MKYGITLARKIIHQKAIKKTKINIKKPINFIICKFEQNNNNYKKYQNIFI